MYTRDERAWRKWKEREGYVGVPMGRKLVTKLLLFEKDNTLFVAQAKN